jgi:phosphopantothenoylcysteine decarboxylase/phosphopantothenate--cysteine ligase
MSKSKNILFIFTGSIACYKACNVLSKLKQHGYNLKVVMSSSSQEFIGRATVEGLTGETPVTETFARGHVMDHINLARWADLVLVAPATANYINKIASGIGDDLLTTLFLAHDFSKPFLVAPAMNTKMYLHPVTQQSINKLKTMGVGILETASGVLACGEVGWGRLLEPDLIYLEVEAALADKSFFEDEVVKPSDTSATPAPEVSVKSLSQSPGSENVPSGPKVLITSGGTTEDIDDVRVISNKSTGRTAAALAESLTEAGFQVTYLHSQKAAQPTLNCKKISFQSYNDLKKELEKTLKTDYYSAVIHAAAVSDYSVVKQNGKISSDADEIQLTLKRNAKLINEIKTWSPKSNLIGFKLTSGADEYAVQAKVDKLFTDSGCDYVVQNDWQQKQTGNHSFRVYSAGDAKKYVTATDTNALAGILFRVLTAQTFNLETNMESL